MCIEVFPLHVVNGLTAVKRMSQAQRRGNDEDSTTAGETLQGLHDWFGFASVVHSSGGVGSAWRRCGARTDCVQHGCARKAAAEVAEARGRADRVRSVRV